jgi:hypothetical protein
MIAVVRAAEVMFPENIALKPTKKRWRESF